MNLSVGTRDRHRGRRQVPVGATWTVNAAPDGLRACATPPATLVGGRTWGGPTKTCTRRTRIGGGRVFVPEADAIWGRGFTYDAGHLEFNVYGCPRRAGSGWCCPSRSSATCGGSARCRAAGPPRRCAPRPWPRARSPRTRSSTTGCGPAATATSPTAPTIRPTWASDKVTGPDGALWAAAVTSTAGQVVTYQGAVIADVLRGLRRRPLRERRGRVARRQHGVRRAVPAGRLRPRRVHAGEPLDQLELRVQRSRRSPAGSRPTPAASARSPGFPARRARRGRPDPARAGQGHGRHGDRERHGPPRGPRPARGPDVDRPQQEHPGSRAREVRRADVRAGAPHHARRLAARWVSPAVRQGRHLPQQRRERHRLDARGPSTPSTSRWAAPAASLGLPTSTIGGFGAMRAAGVHLHVQPRSRFAGGRIYFKTGAGAHALWGPVLERLPRSRRRHGAAGLPHEPRPARRRRRPVRHLRARPHHLPRRRDLHGELIPPSVSAVGRDLRFGRVGRCTRTRRERRSRSWWPDRPSRWPGTSAACSRRQSRARCPSGRSG